MQYPLSDVHTHYDETVFDADRTAVLNAMRDSGVQLIVNSGSSVPSSRRSVELARSFDFMRASVGVFPLEAYTVPEGCLFLLNDCRTQGEDSRHFGGVPEKNVAGKVITLLRRRGL